MLSCGDNHTLVCNCKQRRELFCGQWMSVTWPCVTFFLTSHRAVCGSHVDSLQAREQQWQHNGMCQEQLFFQPTCCCFLQKATFCWLAFSKQNWLSGEKLKLCRLCEGGSKGTIDLWRKWSLFQMKKKTAPFCLGNVACQPVFENEDALLVFISDSFGCLSWSFGWIMFRFVTNISFVCLRRASMHSRLTTILFWVQGAKTYGMHDMSRIAKHSDTCILKESDKQVKCFINLTCNVGVRLLCFCPVQLL